MSKCTRYSIAKLIESNGSLPLSDVNSSNNHEDIPKAYDKSRESKKPAKRLLLIYLSSAFGSLRCVYWFCSTGSGSMYLKKVTESLTILWNIVYVLNSLWKKILSVKNFVSVRIIVGGEFATSRGREIAGCRLLRRTLIPWYR